MLIVEGPDLVGKTTLCKRIEQRLNELGRPHAYAHLSRPSVDLWRELGARAMYIDRASRFAVQDRFHMSDLAYGEICRDGDYMMEAHEYMLLDAELRAMYGAHTILMFAEEDEVLAGRYRDGEMYELEQILRVNAAYRHIARTGRHSDHAGQNFRVAFDCVLPVGRGCRLESFDAIVEVLLVHYLKTQEALA